MVKYIRLILAFLLGLIFFTSYGLCLSGNSTRIYIRIKPEADRQSVLDRINTLEDINNVYCLLPESRSLTFNTKQYRAALFDNKKVRAIIIAEEPLLRTYSLEYTGGKKPEKFVEFLLSNFPEIEIAEVRHPDKMLYTPNDLHVDKQAVLDICHFKEAWDIYQGDASVVIAISDNGTNNAHEDLKGNIAVNVGEIPNNGIDDDGNGFIDDYKGYNYTYKQDGTTPDNTYNTHPHGTQTAGIAAAQFDNSLGIAGTGGKSRLFPIKVAPLGVTDLDYGYESIMYAAEQGFKVINLSWGSVKPYSLFDQSIINYALAYDLAIVAAGGNENTNTEMTYPASYSGVLGVGEVNSYDKYTSTTIGEGVRIMATGISNYSTSLGNSSYQYVGSGTSYSSPVVAGAVALARGKYPGLSAVQAIEFVRQCTDDITSSNYSVKDLIPGRLNVLKIMQTDPYSIPAIVPLQVIFKNEEGTVLDRFEPNEKITMEIKARNYLGTIENVRFVLSKGYDFLNIVNIKDNEVALSKVESQSDFGIEPFSFEFTSEYNEKILFRVDIIGQNGYKDFFLVSFTPTVQITTFANDAIKFSMSDLGTIGFRINANAGNTNEGIGVVYKQLRNQLFKGGLMIGENRQRVISANFDDWGGYDNDFACIKPFSYPNRNLGIVDDSKASANDQMGVQVSQEVFLPEGERSFAKIKLSIKNNSTITLNDISLAYYIDWDLGPVASSYESNKTSLFPEAIPETFIPFPSACEIGEYIGEPYPLVGMMVFTDFTDNAIAQAAGLTYKETQNFDLSGQLSSLYSGTDIQSDEITDISMLVGMRFPGPLVSNEEKECEICLAIAENREEMVRLMHECVLGVSVDNYNISTSKILVSPQPTNDYINITFLEKINSQSTVTLYDITGNKRIEEQHSFTPSTIRLNTAMLHSGFYVLKIAFAASVFTQKIIIIR